METKKNPMHDVHRYRSTFFTLGLILSLALVISAFEWETKKKTRPEPQPDPAFDSWTFNAPLISEPSTPAPAQARQISVAELPAEMEATKEPVEEAVLSGPDPAPVMLSLLPEPLPEQAPDAPIDFAEVMPMPEGGLESFYKVIKKNLHYPRKARAAQVEGRIFIQFTVMPDGTLQDWKVVKGIGFGCDDEAIRVLALTKWNPGRQGGRSVAVRMIQPIVFKLP